MRREVGLKNSLMAPGVRIGEQGELMKICGLDIIAFPPMARKK